jgi:hypothetical protein
MRKRKDPPGAMITDAPPAVRDSGVNIVTVGITTFLVIVVGASLPDFRT